MPVGITADEQKIINKILSKYNYSFYFYGSRVKGNFEKLSDLDILIKDEQKVPFKVLNKLKDEFDKSHLPYIVNLADYQDMDEKFYKLIEQDLVSYTENL